LEQEKTLFLAMFIASQLLIFSVLRYVRGLMEGVKMHFSSICYRFLVTANSEKNFFYETFFWPATYQSGWWWLFWAIDLFEPITWRGCLHA
jgi:hypothetical protein